MSARSRLRPLVLASLLGLTCLLFSACRTVQEHRAAQLRGWVEGLSPAERSRIMAGTIQPGDAPEAVYLAMGSPQYTLLDADERWIWIYWGSPLPESSRSGEVLRFQTRSELRFPKASQERVQLYLFFQDKQLHEWSEQPAHQSVPTGAQRWRMGEKPVPPRPR